MIFFGESGKDGEDRFPGFALQYIHGLNPKYINNKKWANIIYIIYIYKHKTGKVSISKWIRY